MKLLKLVGTLSVYQYLTGTGINLSTCNLSTLLLKLHKLVGTFLVYQYLICLY